MKIKSGIIIFCIAIILVFATNMGYAFKVGPYELTYLSEKVDPLAPEGWSH